MDLKSALGGLKDKVDDLLEKTDIDEKIVEKAGELKEKAGELLEKTDIAVLVTEAGREPVSAEAELVQLILERRIPLVIARNKNVDITAVDINGEAIKYLNENIGLNKLKGNIETYTGDIAI